MKCEKLAGLQPEGVFACFEKLCSIPHGSGNIEAISNYLKEFAESHGVRVIQDPVGDILWFQPATPGYEDHAPVLLQGHMDMVCEKDPGCTLDMAKDPLDLTHDDRFVFARGTTLGGDDGIAVAYAMALLEDPTIPHPPIEVLITVDEETGMTGAENIDMSQFSAMRLINLDSEDEGIFTVSCAGGASVLTKLPAKRKAVYGPCIRLTVEDLKGGHSGVEINENRANANKMLGEFMGRVQKLMPLCLTSISGGNKSNAIPRSASATMVAMGIGLERINDIAAALQQEIRDTYDEPNAIVRADDVDVLGGNAMSTQDTAKVIGFLCACPNGVQAMCPDMPDLPQTSLNMGIVSMDEDSVNVLCSIRSSVNEEKMALGKKVMELAEFYDGKAELMGHYPAWEYKHESALRDTMVAVYEKLYGQKPQVVSIHAGLECGLLSDKKPGLDCVSIGPQMHDIHTSREKLDIASTGRVWEYLLALLKEL